MSSDFIYALIDRDGRRSCSILTAESSEKLQTWIF